MKNKTINLILFSIFTISLAVNAFGQEPIDRAKEFRELQNKSQTILAEKPHRRTTTTEVFDVKGTSPKAKYTSTVEFVPPDRRRYIFTTDKEAEKVELIQIGEDTYIKDEKGKWKKNESRSESYGRAVASSPARFIEKTSLAGQVVNVYEEESSSYSEQAGRQATTVKYWFNLEGQLLKTESEETNQKTDEISREITIYEYDPNIKIEVPIIKREVITKS